MKDPLELDEEERQILKDYERGEFIPVSNFEETKRELEKAAAEFRRKGKRVRHPR